MDVSVVLATYKRQDILQKTLESFSQLDCPALKWELWVVDNAGDPATEKVVQTWAEKLPINYLVELEAGKNNAINRALAEINGQLVVLTDDDIIANPDWLIQLWQGAQRWPEHVVFGGRVLPHWPSGYGPHDLSNPYLVGAYAIANWAFPEGEYEPIKVFGPNMAVRRKIFDEGWRFDGSIGPCQNPGYVMGSETELVMRLEKAGNSPVYLPGALVCHQIRPEQMNFEWLKKRAFRAGLGAAALDSNDPDVKCFAGVPRYLIRKYFEAYFDYVRTRLQNPSKVIEAGMRLYTLKGMISAYRRMRKRENN